MDGLIANNQRANVQQLFQKYSQGNKALGTAFNKIGNQLENLAGTLSRLETFVGMF